MDENLKVTRDIASVLATLEWMSENNMGWLTYRQARKFHVATDYLRQIVDERVRAIKQC